MREIFVFFYCFQKTKYAVALMLGVSLNLFASFTGSDERTIDKDELLSSNVMTALSIVFPFVYRFLYADYLLFLTLFLNTGKNFKIC